MIIHAKLVFRDGNSLLVNFYKCLPRVGERIEIEDHKLSVFSVNHVFLRQEDLVVHNIEILVDEYI